MTILDISIIGVKCAKNDQKMIRKQFEAFPALYYFNETYHLLYCDFILPSCY